MDENNNFSNMGPDPSILSGNPQQPQGNPYGQPQGDPYAQPQGDPYAQQTNGFNQYSQPQQPDMNQYGQQPQGDPYAQQPQGNQFSQQPQPAMEFNSQPQQDFGYQQPAAQMGGQPPVPPKKKKTGLIIGIIVAAIVLIGGGIAAYFLFFNKASDGLDGAEKVCKEFLEAYGELDVDKMFENIPKEATKGIGMSDLSGDRKQVEQTLEFLKGLFEIDDIKVEDSEILEGSDFDSYVDKFNTDNNCSLSFDKGAKVKMSCVIKVSFFGQSEEEEQELTFICGYKDKKWYIIDADEGKSDNDLDEITTEATTDDADMDDLDDSTEADIDDDDMDDDVDDEEGEPFVSTAPSKTVEAPAEVGDKLEDLKFSFDGKVYQIPFAISELPSDWKMIFELDEDEKNIAAGETSYSNGYRNDKYDNSCSLYVSVSNDTDKEIPYEEGKVTSFSFNIAYCDSDNYPELILPKGITWGSNEDDIKAAYGTDYSTYDSTDGDYRILTFSLSGEGYYDTITFYVDHEDGLNNFSMSHSEY